MSQDHTVSAKAPVSEIDDVSLPLTDGREGGSGSGIVLDSVTFRYETGLVAIENLSATIPLGSSLGIVGPSGCGKSTLLHMLAGIKHPTMGSITWPELSNTHEKSMVFQVDTLLPWLTVEKNVGLVFRLNGVPRKRYVERVHELLEMVGLSEFAQSYPYQLSGGMRRRVAFLAAVAPRPAVLLLDEPFASLDEPTRVGIHQDVLQIANSTDTTLVVVTHDLGEAISLCDEIVIMGRRPGRFVTRHRVPFPRERDVYGLRKERAFLDLYSTLWEELSEHVRDVGSGRA